MTARFSRKNFGRKGIAPDSVAGYIRRTMAHVGPSIRLLMRESKRGPFKGAALQLGRQEIRATDGGMV